MRERVRRGPTPECRSNGRSSIPRSGHEPYVGGVAFLLFGRQPGVFRLVGSTQTCNKI